MRIKDQRPVVINQKQKDFIISNYTERSNIWLARALQVRPSIVQGFLTRNRLIRRRRIYEKDPELKNKMGLLLEEWWNGGRLDVLSEKYNIPQGTISRFTSMMFFKRLDEDTEVLVLQSKV